MRIRLAFTAAVLATAAVATIASAAETKVALQGSVSGPGPRPIAGARVFVYTAQPREGVGSACPSCYPECGKSAVTDRKGRFTIAGLSDRLLYRLLVVADGHVPEFRTSVDPIAGPIEQVLRVRTSTPGPGLRRTIGHVVNSRGEPVAGATIMTRGIGVRREDGAEGMMFGDFGRINARIDPVTITDTRGEFVLTGPDSISNWIVHVKARDLAPRVFPEVKAGGDAGLLRLETGALVTGTVSRDGKPAPGVVLGMRMVGGDATSSVDPDTIATDDRGRFEFWNVPANDDYAFSGVIGSMGSWALRTIVRTVGESDSVTRLPPLSLERGFRLRGRLSLSDAKPLPQGTELMLARTLGGKPLRIALDTDGHFELEGMPPETVQLMVRVRGYHIAPALARDVVTTKYGVRIAMLRDREDVAIVLDPDPPATAKGQDATPRP
jgi:hypothetical protein